MNDEAKLLNIIRKYAFALYELNLYLDTHPKCRDALAYFQKYKDLHDKARAEYNEKYGPLTADQTNPANDWTWIKGPWPWERSAN